MSKTAVARGVSDQDLTYTRHWLTEFAKDVAQEVPTKLHTRTPGGLGAAPPFTDAFVGYIGELTCKVAGCIICANAKAPIKQMIVSEEYKIAHRSQSPNRTTKALRKLRKVAPLEFDVLYLAVVQRLTAAEIVVRLNERAVRKGSVDEVYDLESVTILAVCGTDKMSSWF